MLVLIKTIKRYPAFISLGSVPSKGSKKNNSATKPYADKVECHDPSIENLNKCLLEKKFFIITTDY
tara:strand:- start:3176 stop:3373 length:198 start_codon:yes stop_codon:yes gene_type:complete